MSGIQNVIQKSMEEIQASKELKQNTLQYLEEQRRRQERKLFHRKPYRALRYALAVICIFLLAGAGSYSVYSKPVSYISIDVNPSIELGINRFDKVVSAKGYNQDGQDILQHVPLKNISYIQAIDRLLQDAYYSRFLTGDSKLVLTVISDQSDVMLQKINGNDSFQDYGAVTYSSDTACMTEAHQHEMSFGKYRAYLELSQYDANITVEDCHGMTISEIQDRIETCRGHNKENTQKKHSESHKKHHLEEGY